MLIKRVAGTAALAIVEFVRALAGTDESETGEGVDDAGLKQIIDRIPLASMRLSR